MDNCDVKARLEDQSKPGKRLYGKKMLVSHRAYDLWNEETDEFNMENINMLYSMFIYNMYVSTRAFETKWVEASELLTASKGLVWDWTVEEERIMTADSIEQYGLYFPIFTLPKGKLHNQIMDEEELVALSAKGLYNSYNGNHRIDAIHYLCGQNRWDKKVLVYIIPEFCQKSCTGFKYDPIDDKQESYLTQWKLPKPIGMIHLDKVEHEMKVTNWRNSILIHRDISWITVDNYNVAFRIMLEIQNALEPVLTRYYEIHNKFPECITSHNAIFNNEEAWSKWMGDMNEIYERRQGS